MLFNTIASPLCIWKPRKGMRALEVLSGMLQVTLPLPAFPAPALSWAES